MATTRPSDFPEEDFWTTFGGADLPTRLLLRITYAMGTSRRLIMSLGSMLQFQILEFLRRRPVLSELIDGSARRRESE